MYAKVAALYIHSFCRQTWPENADPLTMASTVANGSMMDVFDHKGSGSHKYLPEGKLRGDLETPVGAGVFGYWKMADESYLLRTCQGRLAYWSGNLADKAAWGE